MTGGRLRFTYDGSEVWKGASVAQAAGMLFLRQQAQAPGKGKLGIHPISREVKKLGAGATLYAAVQMLQQVRLCMACRLGLAVLCFALP